MSSWASRAVAAAPSFQTCFVCVHMYILYARVYICVCGYVCGHDICIYMHVGMYLYIYAFIHVCMCMCMHICETRQNGRKMTSFSGVMAKLGAGVDNELGGSASYQCR